MSKKTYRKPTLRVSALENCSMVCASNAPQAFSINEDVGDNGEDGHPGVSHDI